jgi:hypothetical protein
MDGLENLVHVSNAGMFHGWVKKMTMKKLASFLYIITSAKLQYSTAEEATLAILISFILSQKKYL